MRLAPAASTARIDRGALRTDQDPLAAAAGSTEWMGAGKARLTTASATVHRHGYVLNQHERPARLSGALKLRSGHRDFCNKHSIKKERTT